MHRISVAVSKYADYPTRNETDATLKPVIIIDAITIRSRSFNMLV